MKFVKMTPPPLGTCNAPLSENDPQTNQDFEHDPPAKWPPPITAP